MSENENAMELIKEYIKGGAIEVFTAPGQSRDGIVLAGRDLVSPGGGVSVRGYGPSEPQGVIRIYGPWRVGGMFAAYRYFYIRK